jgi:hypothetical protein
VIGTVQVAYGTPTRYEITIYRVTISQLGGHQGWTVARLCGEVLEAGELTLATCPRASLVPPPKGFRF